MERFNQNDKPIFSLHSFGLLWVFIFIATLSIGVQYWAEQNHNRREKEKQELKENGDNSHFKAKKE